MKTSCVVVGGGVAGLTCAYSLREGVTVLEGSDRLGGKIFSDRVGGLIFEGGPDSFITAKPWALELVRELGLEGDLLPTDRVNKDVYVYTRGRLRKLPDGLMLLAPTKVLPFLACDLVPWSVKLRMAWEIFVPSSGPGKDESMADFVRRRLGAEALSVIVDPILAGIYAGDPERLSMASTFPQFVELERKYRSLILGMRAVGRPPSQTGLTMFVALKNGLGTLVDALAERLPGGSLRMGACVSAIERVANAYRVTLADGETLAADQVAVCAPANAAARFLRPLDAALAAELEGISFASTATVSLCYAAKGFPHPLDGFGFVVDRRDARTVMAATFSSTKFPGRVPSDKVLIRCFLGGAGRESAIEGDDESLIREVREDLRIIMGLEAEPLEGRAYRWKDSNPQYNVGHQARLDRIRARLKAFPGLALAGSSYTGVGIPDCVRSARAAAKGLRESSGGLF